MALIAVSTVFALGIVYYFIIEHSTEAIMVPTVKSYGILAQTIAECKQNDIRLVDSNLWAAASTISYIQDVNSAINGNYEGRTTNLLANSYNVA